MKKGAVYEEVYGFERPRWFARNGVTQRDHYSFHRNEVHDMVGIEVKAVREKVGIMDVTAFTKVEVSGRDAYSLLNGLTANRMPQKVGAITLTHMLNQRGRIELETIIVRFEECRFYLVCAAFFEQRLLDHLNHHSSGEVFITSLSNSWSALALNGPKSRDVLSICSNAALDNNSFPWLSASRVTIAGKKVWGFRMSYAGELGWEFHMPNDCCEAVYNALFDAGEKYGIKDYGSFAMNVMRMEKGFKGAGELTNEVTLAEADVMRFVSKNKIYLGHEKTLNTDLPWICSYLEIETDDNHDGAGGEAVLLGGQTVGSISSIVYGHTVGKILAFAYIKPNASKSGTELEVMIQGKPRKAKVLARPAYDPKNLLPRTDLER